MIYYIIYQYENLIMFPLRIVLPAVPTPNFVCADNII